ncbi:ferric reductase-like transmembrane domain-containing protein [Terrabacter sp. NPDC000476]|uniref:ferredoxin reductase family protein n=1 Tax=Terrabacter sp. NPDC000476 TaxID=3154258 RepID=UPI003320B480
MSTTIARHRATPSRVRQALRRGAAFRRWQARTGDVLETLAVASLLVIDAQFLLSGGSHDLTAGGAGTILVAVGRLTGLVAVDLLLLQLVLAARVPWIDRVYGMDRALKAHRVLGRVTVPLVLVHVGAIVLGYAARDGLHGPFAPAVETFRLLTGGSDLLFAFVATSLLVVVAVTSVSIARRRLSYEWWHLVHLTSYAAVVLAVPHELSIGSDFTATAWVRAYWWTLFVLVAAAVLWWRVLVPVARSLRHGLRVTEVVEEAPGVWSVRMEGRRLDRLPVRAGQYLNWRFVSPRLLATAHPWSISSAPDGRHLRITVRELGDHSSRLAHLRPGTRVLFEGPYGGFTARSRVRRRVLLLAAGIGVTPVRSILEELVRHGHAAPGDVTVVYRANDSAQLALRDELEHLTAVGGHRLHLLVGPPADGSWLPPDVTDRRPDAERLADLVPELRRHEAYVCGPGGWMGLVHRSLLEGGIPTTHIHDERFSW